MVCIPCQRKRHADCIGRGFCDCQHREPVTDPQPTKDVVE